MTDHERQQILTMIETGKISAAEGLKLMQALEEASLEEDEPAARFADDTQAETAPGVESFDESDETREQRLSFFASRIRYFRSLWTIPLAVGVLITVGAAYWMYTAFEKTGLGLWFFCSALPFALGVLVIALAFSSRTSHWLYLNVKQKPGEKPNRIVVTFPMNLVAWIYKNAGRFIPDLEHKQVAVAAIEAFENSISPDEPILVEVNDNDEQIQVYIG